MSTEWIKRKRQGWPTGSLERTLSLIGAKSLTQAVAKRMALKREVMGKEDPDYEQMKTIINEIKDKLTNFDTDKMNPITRRRLATMPLTTIKEACLWRDAWLKVLDRGE